MPAVIQTRKGVEKHTDRHTLADNTELGDGTPWVFSPDWKLSPAPDTFLLHSRAPDLHWAFPDLPEHWCYYLSFFPFDSKSVLPQSRYPGRAPKCSARNLNPGSGKKTPRDNATCNRGIYYWLEPGPPALTKGVRTKRPRAPVLSGIYWVQLLVGASGLVIQLQGNFCWPSPSWAFSFPMIGSLFLARHMLIGWLQVAW